MDQREVLVSIIVPAYNEESRLPGSLDQIVDYVTAQSACMEVLVVENGSRDRTTEIAEAYAARYPFIRVLHSDKGKGAAVRTGMLAGRGRYLFMCDSDLSMPIAELSKFLPPMLDGYDVAIGSREGPGAHRYDEPPYRHLMGRVFNMIVRVLAIPQFQDSQCGFKSFRREVACEIFPELTITGWSFDVEALYIALRRGYKVVAVPINWYFDADSRVNPVRDTVRMVKDVWQIRVNGWRGIYTRQRRCVDPADSCCIVPLSLERGLSFDPILSQLRLRNLHEYGKIPGWQCVVADARGGGSLSRPLFLKPFERFFAVYAQ